jgi:hypothetical protein
VGHHRINQIPVYLMPGGAQVIHAADSEKDVLAAVIDFIQNFASITELTAQPIGTLLTRV